MNLALLVLRLCLGAIFVAHGAQKALGLFGGPGIAGFSQMLSGLGFAPPLFWACLAAYTELICGLMVIFGAFTRFASLAILIVMLVATVKVHLLRGFFLSAGGFEYNLLILGVCVALAIIGGGKFSLTKKF